MRRNVYLMYLTIKILYLWQRKKIKPSDLDLKPKATGAIQDEVLYPKEDQTDNKARPTDQANCLETLACNITYGCPVTGGGCETGKICFETGPNCIENTTTCQVKTQQAECLSKLCGERTVDLPCLETEQETCQDTIGLRCQGSVRNCLWTEEGCEVIHPTSDCFETLLEQCQSSDTSCEETSDECQN